MAIEYRGMGFLSAGGTWDNDFPINCTPGIPSNLLNNDILILAAMTGATTQTDITGWTKFPSGGQSATYSKLWWKRTGGSESSPTVLGNSAAIYNFRGVSTDAWPFETSYRLTQAQTWTSLSGMTAGAMVLLINPYKAQYGGGQNLTQTSGICTGKEPNYNWDYLVSDGKGGDMTYSAGVNMLYGLDSDGGETGNVTLPWVAEALFLALKPAAAGGGEVQTDHTTDSGTGYTTAVATQTDTIVVTLNVSAPTANELIAIPYSSYGTGTPGATVEARDRVGVLLGTTTVDELGTWQLTVGVSP